MIDMFVNGELSLPVYVMTAVFALVMLLFWFGGVPYLAVKFGKPASLRRFCLLMTLYTLIVAGCYIFYLYLLCIYDLSGIISGNTPDLDGAFYILAAAEFLAFAAAGIISFNVFKHSNGVDVLPPAQYRHKKPVKATVVGIDEKTTVEYDGKNYVLSKNFRFRLREKIKVRLAEETGKAYLA